ncbi:MAG: ATP-binding cassette domain-containing protein [Candidatus Aminicenantes bacterium]|nr:ATP-binding cassette domain-containing protein [Candidatus Aminicenantes bacterium]
MKAIEIEGLTYTFPDGTLALENITFSLDEGKKMVIIGPNGSGKTTLLLNLRGLLRGQGTIRFFGEELNDRNIQLLGKKIGLIFQNPDDQLFMPTVFDDVAFGLTLSLKGKSSFKKIKRIRETEPEEIQLDQETQRIVNRVKNILRELKAAHLLTRSTLKLSLGEKKKVALAGVLVLEPEVLLLDEPTLGLDPGTRRWLINYLRDSKKTIIATTQDMEFAWELAEQVVLINQGKIIALGSKEEILSDQDLLEAHGLELPLNYLLAQLKNN